LHDFILDDEESEWPGSEGAVEGVAHRVNKHLPMKRLAQKEISKTKKEKIGN